MVPVRFKLKPEQLIEAAVRDDEGKKEPRDPPVGGAGPPRYRPERPLGDGEVCGGIRQPYALVDV